jgi:hypothetical protein
MTVLNVIVLALAAAVYPMLLAGVILILSRPNPLRLLIAFLVGGMSISIVAGWVIVKALDSTGVVSESNSSNKPILDIVVGIASLVVAWGIWSGRVKGGLRNRNPGTRQQHRHRASAWTRRLLSRDSITMAFVVGVMLNLPGIWYLDALAGIAKSDTSDLEALLLIVLFNGIMFALAEIPIVAYLVNPQGAADVVEHSAERARSQARPIAITVALAVGVWLLIKGILDLAT